MAKMIEPGKYRHKIDVLEKKKDPLNSSRHERDVYGELTEAWVVFKSGIWAKKEPIMGKEFFAGLTTDSKVELKIECRYVSGITAEMRIKHGDMVYEIIGEPVNVREENREILMYCQKVK